MAKSTVARIRKKAKRAKKTVRRGSAKAKRKVSDAASTVKRRAAKAKKTAKRAKKAVKRATKKVKKTARRAKRAVKRVAKKAKRKARKARIRQASAERDVTLGIIAKVNDSFADALTRGDVDAVAAIYSLDARLLPAGRPMRSGREAIREYWKIVIEGSGVTGVNLESLDVHIDRRRAEEVGRFSLSGEGGMLDEGKYVVVWNREPGGTWKRRIDIWNRDH